MVKFWFGAVAVLSLISDLQCRQWSSTFKDDVIVNACVGGQGSFLWDAELEEGEHIVLITWTFDDLFSTKTIAKYSPDDLLVSEDYRHRVQQVGNAGIVLSELRLEDKGNYSVELSGRGASGSLFTMRRGAFLQLGDRLMVKDGEVRVTQLAEAQQDDDGRWSVALACGQFLHLGLPPVSVEWTTPSGDELSSSRYDQEKKSFVLLLSNPVTGGSYTCSIPQTFARDVCASADDIQAGRINDTIPVDEVKARMSLLEMHLTDNRDLRAKVLSLESEIANKDFQIASLDSKITSLDSEITSLKEADVNSSKVMSSIDAQLQTNVAFMTQVNRNVKIAAHGRVKFGNVRYNEGKGYNPDTGEFTVPVSGTYCFFMKTESDVNHLVGLDMKKNGARILYMYAYDEHSFQTPSGTVVVPMNQGDRVWVVTSGHGQSTVRTWTTFGGFLLHSQFPSIE